MRRGALLWLGLAIAFSPVLINLVEGLRTNPADRYTLLVPLGIALHFAAGARHRDAASKRDGVDASGATGRFGVALIATGLAIELLGIASASWGIARLGLPIAALGVTSHLGAPSILLVLTVFGVVPLPSFVQHAASPALETAAGGALATLFSAVGAEIEARGPLLFASGGRLELLAADSGLITAAALFLGGWFTGLQADSDARRLVRGAFAAALFAIAVHPLILVAATGLLLAGASDAARSFLTYAAPLGVAVWCGLAMLRANAATEGATRDAPVGTTEPDAG